MERDPALRLQVWKYPQNQRDDIGRVYLRLGSTQTKINNIYSYWTHIFLVILHHG
jgi:hypothetical protein